MGCRWIFFLLILVMLAGCRSPSMISDPKKVETFGDDEKTVITFWHTYNEKETRLLDNVLIPAFERENPNIQVESIDLAFNNELINTLIARTSSKRGPDVVRLQLAWIPEFLYKELLEPLDGFGDFEHIRKRFHTNLMNIGLYQNKYYSLPLNIYTKTPIFNRELLERAGYSKPPSTMDEVLKLARRYRYTIGLRGLGPWDTIPYIYSLGGSFINEEANTASGYLNSDETIHAVEQLTALYKENLIDLPHDTLGAEENWERIKSGNMLMTDDGPWFYSLLDESEFDCALKLTVPVPFPQNNGPASLIGGENLVIMKGSNRKAEAWTFMKWMTAKKAQLLLLEHTELIPTNLEAAKTSTITRDSYLYPYREDAKNAILLPLVMNWSKIDGVYTEYMNKIFEGDLSVTEGLDRAAAEIDRLLAESN
ncbi:extracellular solute-binding protein [Bacillus solitudinis]|uniref:extracellular solute-binding protein n=1 Tax=Bacillus solitudinis TaxID=2014074 RepID=UPI0012FE6324|nr:extracellular solute-binding protein [Bacillus solitudinis]